MPEKPLSQWTNEELWRIFPVVLREHDPNWRSLYEDEAVAIKRALGENAVSRIRHIGSTAVPGLIAKPTIDILLEIAEGVDVNSLRAAMEGIGYLLSPQQNNPAPHAMFLKGYTPQGFSGQCFHVHVRYFGDYDEPHFCAYLKTHPETAAQYGALKTELQRRFGHDRDAYTKAKTEFIEWVTARAREQAHTVKRKDK